MEMGFKTKLEAPVGLFVAAPGRIGNNMKAPKDTRIFRQRTVADFEIWRVIPERPSSLTLVAPGTTKVNPDGNRPKSEMDAKIPKPHKRIPILGPTRQQTELYLKKRVKLITRQNVVPVDGPAQDLAVGKRTEQLAVFDNKAANDVLLDAEAQIKSGYPTIATSTLVKRAPLLDDTGEEQSAIKFFSELVKPVKYRWKFEKEKLKTLVPSKQGFHQRSHSPTFQRLVEANEKLHTLVNRKPDRERTREEFEETKSMFTDTVDRPAVMRYAKSESQTQRTSTIRSMETMTSKFNDVVQPSLLKSDTWTIDPMKTDIVPFEENKYKDDLEEYNSGYQSPRQPTSKSNKISEFKVDFKKMDSHSELHLFLPHIEDAHSRLATPDNKHTLNDMHKVALPIILHPNDASDTKPLDDDKMKPKKSQKADLKKKRKKHLRIKSGNDEKEIRDRLNDVPTLISLEKEKTDVHSSSMCVFENCAQHAHYRKSTKIRQA